MKQQTVMANTPATSLAKLIERWCAEAVGHWGNDWQKISTYIEERYAALDPADRAALEHEAHITLEYAGKTNAPHSGLASDMQH